MPTTTAATGPPFSELPTKLRDKVWHDQLPGPRTIKLILFDLTEFTGEKAVLKPMRPDQGPSSSSSSGANNVEQQQHGSPKVKFYLISSSEGRAELATCHADEVVRRPMSDAVQLPVANVCAAGYLLMDRLRICDEGRVGHDEEYSIEPPIWSNPKIDRCTSTSGG
jgi:hypothetical protein